MAIKFHKNQLEFLNGKSKAKIRLALAGRQGGKTEVGCTGLARALRGHRNEQFMLVAPTYKILHQASMIKLEEVLRRMHPDFIVYRNERDKAYWKDMNGNVIFLRSTEKPHTLRGPTLREVLFDEAAMTPTGIAYRTLLPALAVKQGKIWLTTTPQGPNWIMQEIIKPWEKGDKNIHIAKWRSIDNPVFPREEYEFAKRHYDERWVRQEYDAEIADVGGIVFPEFDENRHVKNFEFNPKLDVYWSMDFGIANPTFICFWQFDPQKGPEGHYYMFDEFQIRDYKLEDVIAMALEKGYMDETGKKVNYPKPVMTPCDPSGRYREKIAGVGAVEILDQFGLNPVWEPDANTAQVRMKGINEMHYLLKNDMISFHGENCWHMIRAFSFYSRKMQKEGERAEEMPYKDGTSDHCMEASFYFMPFRPRKVISTGLYIDEEYEPVNQVTGF